MNESLPPQNTDVIGRWQQRFGGVVRLYGVQGAQVLMRAHVCVIGIGGVGCWVAEALARTGVGGITLMDLDDVCITNTNRQLHATQDTVGQSKAKVLAQRLLAIHPDCTVNVIEDFLTHDNTTEHISKDFDMVVDAIDEASVKAHLIAHCKRNKIPIITTGAAGGQDDPTQVQVSDLSKTYNDPLAAKVRNTLRRHYNFSRNEKRSFGVPCVYSKQQLKYPMPDGSVCTQKSTMASGVRLDCSGGFGASAMVTGTFGFVVASKVVEKIISRYLAR